MIEVLREYLQEYRKSKDILIFLNAFYQGDTKKVSSRQFRKAKEIWNDMFFEGKVDQILVHSNSKGYKLTNDPEEIMEMRNDYNSRARDMYYKVRQIDKYIKKDPLLRTTNPNKFKK